MFAGIGGICLGFKQAGFEVVWANEMDSAACRTYRNYFGNTYLVEGDIRGIDKKTIPQFDILTAGFPCQPFSLAGPHKGFEDKRGNLFFEIVEVAKRTQPKIVFLENVANLIEHDNGRTFITIFNALSELNYILRYQNMPSNEYGYTPQTRNRTYIVALIKRNVRQKDIYYYQPQDRIWDYMVKQVKRTDSIYRVHDSGIHLAKNHTCPTLTASMGTRDDMVPIIIDNFGYRKLTVRECLDFQCFPKNFSFPHGTTIEEAYKQIGNSVCVTVIRRIAEQIKRVMEVKVKDALQQY